MVMAANQILIFVKRMLGLNNLEKHYKILCTLKHSIRKTYTTIVKTYLAFVRFRKNND